MVKGNFSHKSQLLTVKVQCVELSSKTDLAEMEYNICKYFLGKMAMQWLALLPHSKRALGMSGRALLHGVCMCFQGIPASFHRPTTCRLGQVVTLIAM